MTRDQESVVLHPQDFEFSGGEVVGCLVVLREGGGYDISVSCIFLFLLVSSGLPYALVDFLNII